MTLKYETPFELKNGVWVFPQTDEGKANGDSVVQEVLKKWIPPKRYYHFYSGGHVKALLEHKSNHCFGVIDIKSFFTSTTRSMLIRTLKKIGFNYKRAMSLSTESTVTHHSCTTRFIPYGFTQSALLATLCLEYSRLGSALNDIPNDILVTIYMDDIIFSSTEENKEILEKHYEQILGIFEKPPYSLNIHKYQSVNSRVKVFNTILSYNNIEIIESRMEEFKHAIDGNGNYASVDGIIKYVEKLNDVQASELQDFVQN